MNLVEFSTELEEHITNVVKETVGEGTDPDNWVRSFDDHLHDFDLAYTPNPWPFVVVAVRDMELSGRSEPEIGTDHAYNLHTWTAHIYYIDVVQDYATGKRKRDNIMGRISRIFERDPRIMNFEVSDELGREYVWDSRITNLVRDQSGQETEYAFVCEMYVSIDTAKS